MSNAEHGDLVKDVEDLLDVIGFISSARVAPKHHHCKGKSEGTSQPKGSARPQSFPVEIYDDKEAYTLAATLPGYSREEISISVEDNYLTIKAPGKTKANVIFTEFKDKNGFERKLTLSPDIDTDSMTATLDKGILYVTVGKIKANPPKKIIIS